MTTNAATSAVEVVTALGGASTAWPDELWAGSMRLGDAILRSYYGVYEFTEDPACIFRIGLSEARNAVTLSDGTQIRRGEVIGTLHFSNEQLPRYSIQGPDFHWACAIRDQVRHSLYALADHIEIDPDWREVRALRGEAAFSAGLGISQVRRVAARYGFERVPTKPSLFSRLQRVGESFVLWGLARAFNPAAAPRQPFLRDHHELWISRSTLRQRYAGRPRDLRSAARHRRGP
jgi:YkoP-like protein